MKKLFGLAMLLAMSPLVSFAETPVSQQQRPQPYPVMTPRTEAGRPLEMNRPMPSPQIGIGVASPAGRIAIDPQVSPLWVKGQWSLVSRQYPEAVNAFQDLLSIDSNNVHALNGLAQALHAQGRYEEALIRIERAISLDPVNSRLFLTKAQILDAQDKPQAAVEAYYTFTALSPEDGASVMAHRRAEELRRRLEPTLSEGWRNYLEGLHMLSLQQPQQAIPLFEKFTAVEPGNTEAQLLLGRAYLELGQPSRAIPFFQTALKTDAQNPVAYYQLGSTYELSGQPKMAAEAWQKFVQFAPHSETAMLLGRRTSESR